MRRSEPTTHIRIKVSTKIKLDTMNDKWGAYTYDDIIQQLLVFYDTPPEAGA